MCLAIAFCTSPHVTRLFIHNDLPQISRRAPYGPSRGRLRRTQVARNAVTSEVQKKSRISEGTVVEVTVSANNKHRLAVAQRANGKRNWIVVDSAGVSVSVTPKQVTYIIGDHLEALGASNLQSLENSIQKALSNVDGLIETAWEIFGGESEVTVEEITKIIFGASDPKQQYIAHRLLQTDKTYFKIKFIKGDYVYEPRSSKAVEETRKQERLENERLEKAKREKAQIAKSIENEDAAKAQAVLGDNYERICQSLITFATTLDAYSGDVKADFAFQSLKLIERNDVRYIAEATGKPVNAQTACEALAAWGVFSKHENIFVRALDLHNDMAHDPLLVDIAQQLARDPPEDIDADRRVDLSHLTSYAIDSEKTTEVDDAISWDAENQKIWVHIADPTRYLPGGAENPLTREALRRVTTLYLPAGKVTMFPEAVASELFSLDSSRNDGSALSFGFRIMEDGEIDEDTISIVCSRILRPVRMTYGQADEAIENGTIQDLSNVFAEALRRRGCRERMGAILLNRPFCDVFVTNEKSENPSIRLRTVDAETPSWTLVSELMICACTAAAYFAEENEVPIIFRGQEKFNLPPEEEVEEMHPLARGSLLFQNATPSMMRLAAADHASLGVDAYTQVTSPIRRASDLIAHLQFKAHLRGDDEYPLDTEALGAEIARDFDRGRRLKQAESRTNKYWLLVFLGRRMGRQWDGVVTRLVGKDERFGFIWLLPFGFEIGMRVPIGTKLGALVEVVVNTVYPRYGEVKGTVKIRRAIKGNKKPKDKIVSEDVSDIESEVDTEAEVL